MRPLLVLRAFSAAYQPYCASWALLGDRSLMSEDLEEDFQRSGITHIHPKSREADLRAVLGSDITHV